MSEDTQTISLEDGDGAPLAPPPELATETPAVPSAPVVEETPATPPAATLAAALPAEQLPEVARGILNDLREERKARQTAEARAARVEAEHAPWIAALNRHPDVQAMLREREDGGTTTKVTAPGASPEQLTALAKDLALYKPDGSMSLDLEAAARVNASMHSVATEAATRAVNQAVGPIAGKIQATEAQSSRATVTAFATQNMGMSEADVAPVLDALQAQSPQLLSDPQAIMIALLTAKGRQAMSGAPAHVPASANPPATVPAQRPPAPAFLDPGSGRTAAPTNLTNLEKKVASKHGMTQEQFGKQVSSLEAYDPSSGNRHIAFEGEK